MEEKFVVAAAAGELERVRECIRRIGVNINWQDERGETALMKAARRGDGSVSMELVNAGANCDLTSESGNTALHFACKQGHRHIVRLLGVTGADVNVKNSKGNTPSHLAASRSELSVLDELNRLGCDWMITNKEGRNALEQAKHEKQPEAIKIITNMMAGTYSSGSLEVEHTSRIRELVKKGSPNLSLTPLDEIEVVTRGNLDKDKEVDRLRQLNDEIMSQLEKQIAENKKLEIDIEKQREDQDNLTEEDQTIWAEITEQFNEKAKLRKQKAAMDKEMRELKQQYDDQRCQLTLLTDKVVVLRRDCTDLHRRLDACEQLLKNSELACQESQKRRKEVVAILAIPQEDIKRTDKKLVRGSFGDACIGTWRGSLVAVKTFTYTWIKSKDNADVFEKEAAFCSRILHPHVAIIHGILQREGATVSLITELLQGSLEDVIQAAHGSNQYLTLREQVDLSHDCLSGLSFLHRPVRQYVHTDLRPCNILISTLMKAKIGELGIACLSRVLHTNNGSSQYTAPETAENQDFTPESDVFSMGVVLCELFTGKHAVQVHGVQALIESVDVSDLQTVCDRMVCLNPSERLPAVDTLKMVNPVALMMEYSKCPPKRLVKGLLEGSERLTLIDSSF